MSEYDEGGWLESGLSMVTNHGKPEPILTAEQWRRDE